jgi:hypothetical protein
LGEGRRSDRVCGARIGQVGWIMSARGASIELLTARNCLARRTRRRHVGGRCKDRSSTSPSTFAFWSTNRPTRSGSWGRSSTCDQWTKNPELGDLAVVSPEPPPTCSYVSSVPGCLPTSPGRISPSPMTSAVNEPSPARPPQHRRTPPRQKWQLWTIPFRSLSTGPQQRSGRR